MSKAVRIHATGGPAVMRWEDHDPGNPGPGEVRLHQLVIIEWRFVIRPI